MNYVTVSRKAIYTITALQFVTTFALGTPLNALLLLPANLFQHVLAIVFFVCALTLLYGAIIKRQYRFTWWDLVLLAFIFLLAHDYWYTLTTPHPLFHDRYYI